MRMLAVAALFIVALGAHDWGAARPLDWRSSAAPPVIGLRVVANRKSPADMWVRAGQQATVGIRGGLNAGLTPVLHDSTIDLVIVRLADESGGGEPEEVGKFEMRLSDVVEFDVASMHLEVEWMGLLPQPAAGGGVMPDGPCTTCCVECEGSLRCACRVTTECGSCCCPKACVCQFGTASVAEPLRMAGNRCTAPALPPPH